MSLPPWVLHVRTTQGHVLVDNGLMGDVRWYSDLLGMSLGVLYERACPDGPRPVSRFDLAY